MTVVADANGQNPAENKNLLDGNPNSGWDGKWDKVTESDPSVIVLDLGKDQIQALAKLGGALPAGYHLAALSDSYYIDNGQIRVSVEKDAVTPEQPVKPDAKPGDNAQQGTSEAAHSKLPKTQGVLWTPVLILAFAGAALTLYGLNRKKREQN